MPYAIASGPAQRCAGCDGFGRRQEAGEHGRRLLRELRAVGAELEVAEAMLVRAEERAGAADERAAAEAERSRGALEAVARGMRGLEGGWGVVERCLELAKAASEQVISGIFSYLALAQARDRAWGLCL